MHWQPTKCCRLSLCFHVCLRPITNNLAPTAACYDGRKEALQAIATASFFIRQYCYHFDYWLSLQTWHSDQPSFLWTWDWPRSCQPYSWLWSGWGTRHFNYCTANYGFNLWVCCQSGYSTSETSHSSISDYVNCFDFELWNFGQLLRNHRAPYSNSNRFAR